MHENEEVRSLREFIPGVEGPVVIRHPNLKASGMCDEDHSI